jgi:hypothetical protein
MNLLSAIPDLASFGAAGIIGAMWLWERRASRQRDEQLAQAHQRIVRDEQRLEKLVQVVQQNTAALTHFAEVQRNMSQTLRDLARTR